MKKLFKQVTEKILLLVIMPGLVFTLLEITIRVSGINVDTITNKRFEIDIPNWLITNEDWVFAAKFRQDHQGRRINVDRIKWQKNYRKNRYVEYKLKPDIDKYCVNDFNKLEVARNIRFHVTTNKYGYRTKEFTISKPFNTFRIITLGDSSTFGWGVDNDKTYASQLETLLRSRQKFQSLKFEVINMGVPGYTSEHGVRLLHKVVPPLDPDLLIVSFGVNDARISLHSAAERLARENSLAGWMKEKLEYLYFYKLLRKMVFRIHDPFDSDLEKQRKNTKPNVDPESFKNNLQEFIDYMDNKNKFIILLCICAPDNYRDIMEHVALENNVPYVDAFNLFQSNMDDIKSGKIFVEEMKYYRGIYGETELRQKQSRYVTSDGCHPHIIGHKIISQKLADIILYPITEYHSNANLTPKKASLTTKK